MLLLPQILLLLLNSFCFKHFLQSCVFLLHHMLLLLLNSFCFKHFLQSCVFLLHQMLLLLLVVLPGFYLLLIPQLIPHSFLHC